MLSVAFDFTWERPAKGKGFAWEKTDAGGLCLVRTAGAPFERYKPLEECTGLFRTFADLPPDPVALLGFVNRYGALGGEWDEFGLWKEGVARMKSLVAAWNALAT